MIRGHQRGHGLGFPTANLDIRDQLIPGDGVYAARCIVDQASYAAALSIGTLPTFNGEARQIEAHLIAFEGDLYGCTLHVEMLDWLRDQQKYPSLDALKAQLHEDVAVTAGRSALDPAAPIARVV